MGGPSGVDLVRTFLKGQNLEQVGKTDEAVELYEDAVAAGFDAPGPYDRLIEIYSNQALHREVVRVSEAALEHVKTHESKREWFARIRDEAETAASSVPAAAPKRKA